MKKICLFSIIYVCMTFLSVAQSGNIKREKYIIDSVTHASARQFMGNPGAVSLSIGIYVNGCTHTYFYGETEKENKIKPTVNSLYSIASISKTFAGLLLAEAVEENKIGLDDDIRKYMTGDYPNLSYNSQPIRIRDLMNHRSGLPFLIPDVSQRFRDTSLTTADIAALLYKKTSRVDFYAALHNVKLDTLPGTNFKYSNTAVILLGYILESVYGKGYQVLLKEKILDPLGMKNTSISLTPEGEKQFVKAYDEKGNLLPENTDAFQAAAGIKSSTSDMLKYIRWNLDESNEMVRLAHSRIWGDPTATYYAGLNWQILSSGNERVIWQEGNLPGFNGYCVIFPELKIGITVLTNESDRTSSHRLTNLINQITKSLNNHAIALP
jgi:D-alanyl-D-alanine-carboxypeptidase/D-alanyl-D-alanine-endopeptidase